MIIIIVFLLTAAACYSLGAAWYCWLWLQLLRSSHEGLDDLLESSLMLVLATLLWPVVVPIAYSEIVEASIRRCREALGEEVL